MGWKPEETLKYIGIVAAGEEGRKQLSLPGAVLEALVNPQMANLKDYRIFPKQAEDPAKLLAIVAAKRGKMTEQAFGRMLKDIYGTEGGIGISKLLATPGGEMAAAIKEAATPQAAAAEMADEETSRKTMERIGAQTQAVRMGIQQDVTQKENYQKQIRDIGADAQENLQRRHPYLQWISEHISPSGIGLGVIPEYLISNFKSEATKKEDAGFMRWMRNLSPEEKTRILNETEAPSFVGPIPLISTGSKQLFQLKNHFKALPVKQQYEELITGSEDLGSTFNVGPAQQSERITQLSTVNNFHTEYHADTIYYPVAGTAADRDIGPRAERGLN
jgi:hypothetical protein